MDDKEIISEIAKLVKQVRADERKNRKQQSLPLLEKLETLECKKADIDKVQVTISVKDYEEIRKLFLELVNE